MLHHVNFCITRIFWLEIGMLGTSAVNRAESSRVSERRARLVTNSSQARARSIAQTSYDMHSNSTRKMEMWLELELELDSFIKNELGSDELELELEICIRARGSRLDFRLEFEARGSILRLDFAIEQSVYEVLLQHIQI